MWALYVSFKSRKTESVQEFFKQKSGLLKQK